MVAPARRACASYEVPRKERATISHARTFTNRPDRHKVRLHRGRPAEAIITTERERLVTRIEDIRSMLRDSTSLDVIETLVLALADLEQRVAWIDGEVTPEPASPQPHAQAENTLRATPPNPTP
jgi:hypothetical protein